MSRELWQKSASDLTLGYANDEWSPLEVVDAIIARVEKVNPLINAIVTLDAEGARTAATASEARWKRGAANRSLRRRTDQRKGQHSGARASDDLGKQALR